MLKLHPQKPLLIWLVAITLALRAVVPSGYMPTLAADGYGFTFQLCGINSERLLYLDLETGRYTGVDQAPIEQEQDGQHPHAVCPFALSLLAVALCPAMPCVKPTYGRVYAQQPPARTPPNSTTLPPLPPRGPPPYLLRLTH